MEAPKIPHLMMTLIIVSCCAVLGSCESIADNNGNSTSSCITQLLPCQPYLNKTTTPPSACCVPLKQMVTGNTQCLCYIFNNPAILRQLNITQADALALAQKCSANADISVCKTGKATPIIIIIIIKMNQGSFHFLDISFLFWIFYCHCRNSRQLNTIHSWQ